MRESRSYGSVRGALSDERPYRELCEIAFEEKRGSRTSSSTWSVKPQVVDEERVEGVIDVRRPGWMIVVDAFSFAKNNLSLGKPLQN